MKRLPDETWLRDPAMLAQLRNKAHRARAKVVGRIATRIKQAIDNLRARMRLAFARIPDGAIQVDVHALRRGVPMLIDFAHSSPVILQDGRGVVVRVLQGMVWLTHQGRSEDIFVQGGECFVIARDGTTIVSHLGKAALTRIELCAATPAWIPVSLWASALIRAVLARPSRLRRLSKRLAGNWA